MVKIFTRHGVVPIVTALFFFNSIPVGAQQAATLSGRVTDPSGASVGAAEVAAKQITGGATARTVTNLQGRFSFASLTPGKYQITVRSKGFDDSIQFIELASGAAIDQVFPVTLAARSDSASVDAKLSAIPMESPTAQVVTTVSQEDFRYTPAFSVTDIFDLTAGVTTLQGNGPRDVSVSVRGSNERQTFGVRNIQMSEDGFPITQPDGLGRTDLSDPHGYNGVEVVQGPSSALYGNYATGGAVNFHTRQTQGIEVGTDFGSFGYLNDYVTMGASGDQYRVTALLSNVRGNPHTEHTKYDTFTADILASYSVTAKDRITFKFIDNELATQLSIRLSLNQYNLNPWQLGCAALAGTGCASVSVFANGFNGPKVSLSANQAGLQRKDRRTIAGGRWEHDITSNTTWRTQFVWDNRDINQPTGATSAIGPYPSWNLVTDLLRHGSLLGRQSTTYVAFSFNFLNQKGLTYNVAPGGNATFGGLAATVTGSHWNGGFRARQEIVFSRRWTAVMGAGVERTGIAANESLDTYPSNSPPVITLIQARRDYLNFAPEGALRFQATQKLALHSHAGAGYGTPQIGNLFITPQGAYGNNTLLKPQKNAGIDLGADLTLGPMLKLSAAGFQEWFHNELVSQSPGVSLLNYTFNAPASSHKGVEGVAELKPIYSLLPGLRVRASYLFDRQTYTQYTETLTAGIYAMTFDRKGNLIPGVTPQFLNVRLVYDEAQGPLRGVGGFVEEDIRSSLFLDNANLLRAPGANTLNFNLHFNPVADHGFLSRLNFYLEIKNVIGKAYVASASNISDSLSSSTGLENGVAALATSGSIWAGPPRAFFGGVRIKLMR